MRVLTLDLHTHLLEKDVKPAALWRHAKEKRLDAIAITEHVEENPARAFQLLLEKKPPGIKLLPGMELNTSIGHVIALSDSPELYEINEFLKRGLQIKKATKIAAETNVLLSIAHPWGFSYDSASFIFGEKRLTRLVEENFIGVEAFNGMMGSIGNFIYGTNWVKKPLNFFDFLEKNRLARKTGLDRLGRKLKKKIDKKSREVIERCAKPIELGEKAAFITAGSDSHSASRIGNGVLKIKAKAKKIDNAKLIELIEKKERVVWAGPFVEEAPNGSYRLNAESLKRAEIIAGVKYATISSGRKKLKQLGLKIKKKIRRKRK